MMGLSAEELLQGANTAIMLGIFMRLGSLGEAMNGIKSRVSKLEGLEKC